MPEKKRPIIIRPDSPSSVYDEARRVFNDGRIIAYPTETFYGLCVDPFNRSAISRLYALKGRETKSPVSVLVKDLEMLKTVVKDIPSLADALIKKFWPGPLTIVFKANPAVPAGLTGSTGRIGARISSNLLANRLLEELGAPITATSANPSGKKAPVTSKEVLDYFNGSIDILIEGGMLKGRLGSTVVDATGKRLKIIREGDIPLTGIVG